MTLWPVCCATGLRRSRAIGCRALGDLPLMQGMKCGQRAAALGCRETAFVDIGHTD